ncbi:hypothetical protein HY623_03950 [Candidatus Uhrbacteria bacterium]|nr:hypothetical protein [Candidatus Uhrbacteria bacterium]
MNQYSSQFEQARQAVTTITAVRQHLSPSELESLALMLDHQSMNIIEQSRDDERNGKFESLEDAIKNS